MVCDVNAKHGDSQSCFPVPMCVCGLCVFSCVRRCVVICECDSGLIICVFILALWSRRCL